MVFLRLLVVGLEGQIGQPDNERNLIVDGKDSLVMLKKGR